MFIGILLERFKMGKLLNFCHYF